MGRGRGKGSKVNVLQAIGIGRPTKKEKEEAALKAKFPKDFDTYWPTKGYTVGDAPLAGASEIVPVSLSTSRISRLCETTEDITLKVFYHVHKKSYRGFVGVERMINKKGDWVMSPQHTAYKEFAGDLDKILPELQKEFDSARQELWIKEIEKPDKYVTDRIKKTFDTVKAITPKDVKDSAKNILTQNEYNARLKKDEEDRKNRIFAEADKAVENEYTDLS